MYDLGGHGCLRGIDTQAGDQELRRLIVLMDGWSPLNRLGAWAYNLIISCPGRIYRLSRAAASAFCGLLQSSVGRSWVRGASSSFI
jgi:hypothetical protein